MNNYEKSRAIAAATERCAATSYTDYFVIRSIMQETGCTRPTARRHLAYYYRPELRPIVGGAGRKQGRKPGSKNKASRPA